MLQMTSHEASTINLDDRHFDHNVLNATFASTKTGQIIWC